MILIYLKNVVIRQETRFCGVVGREYTSSRYGVGLGTLSPPNWYVILENDEGRIYRIATNDPLWNFNPNKLNKGDKVRVQVTNFLGIPVYGELKGDDK